MTQAEAEVCKDVRLISLDATSKRLTCVSASGHLFDLQSPETRLDLQTVCKLDAWTAVGSLNGRILVAGTNKSTKSYQYVLLDSQTLTVLDKSANEKDFDASYPIL